MNIETKHILALIFLVAFGAGGFLAAILSQRARDIALFVLTFGAVLMEKVDVTFLGQFWYRGTSRGIEVSALDIAPACLLITTLLLPRYVRGRFYWPASFGLMLVYFIYCCVSVANAEPQIYGIWELAKIARGIMVFLAAALFIRSRRELGIVVLALGCVVCMEAGNSIEQRLFKGAFRPSGTLDHENTLSTYLCMVGPVLMAATMSHWSKALRWFAGISCIAAAGAELLTLSRMGVPVFFFVTICTAIAGTSWRITQQKIAIIALAIVAMGSLVYVSWDGLKARYMQGDIRAELTDDKQFETRGVYWRLAGLMIEDHPRGVGLNNWSYYVSKTYGPELGYHYVDYDDFKWTPTKDEAHETTLPPAADTLPALMIGELGISGLVVFLVIWLRWFQMGASFLRRRLDPDPMHRMAIGFLFGAVGIFLQSATEWTYRQSPVMFTFHVMMGALASLYYIRRRGWVAVERVPAPHVRVEAEAVPIPVMARGESFPSPQST
jgi:hypothetical protein